MVDYLWTFDEKILSCIELSFDLFWTFGMSIFFLSSIWRFLLKFLNNVEGYLDCLIYTMIYSIVK